MSITGGETERSDLNSDSLAGSATYRLADLGGSLVLVAGQLYREVQVKHPRNARFTLQNERGLFFVKVYQAALITMAQGFEPGAELVVLGEMHSFVSRRCKNHHVFIQAATIFPLTEPAENWVVRIEKGTDGVIIGQP